MRRAPSPASIRPVSTASKNGRRPDRRQAAISVAAITAGLIATLITGLPALADETCRSGATPMRRVELYFGARRADAPAWRRFLRTEVTPRFPDGLTELTGTGQWRGPRGLLRERSHVLIVFYRPDATSDARIEAIPTRYRSRFAQISVLRVDASACVAF